MRTEFTPGPWIIRERTGRPHITPEDNQFFTIAAASGFNTSEALANAKLICAAPDLLQACKAALTWMQCGSEAGRSNNIEFLAKAIAKAEKGAA